MTVLAYILWHWPGPGVDAASYERDELDFHRALTAAAPAGFRSSAVFRSAGAPWIPAGEAGYEDWYLLSGYSALDVLNDAAVAGARTEPHDRVAAAVGGMAAGLYALRTGKPPSPDELVAVWLAKPRGTPYADFYARLEPWTSRAGVSLWRRQMVLGPTPEFCLLAAGGLEPPAELVAARVALEPVA